MKKIAKILPVLMVLCLAFTSAYADIINVPTGDLTYGQGGSAAVKNTAGAIWNTIITIVQILAVAAVVFAGLRYMFASADQKADIKKSMGTLAIGAVLVFGASTVLKFVSTASNQVLNPTQQQQQQQQQQNGGGGKPDTSGDDKVNMIN